MLSLASSSAVRASILKASKIPFQTVSANIDEDSIKRSLEYEGASPRDIADTLAEFKARKASLKIKGLVLGCDQVLVFKGQISGKPADRENLKHTLLQLRGQAHDLLTANVLYQDGKPIWRHVGRVTMHMRDLSDQEIDDYIEQHWDRVKYSAGGYTVENTPYLFHDIKGDWFDILGLSLDPLRGFLRMHEITATQRPKLAGVIGFPIAYSKSPRLHGYWLDELGVPGFYSAIECPPAYFNDTVNLLSKMGFSGANVTIPHKESALGLADHRTDAAQKIGASNTLIFESDEIKADNTDGVGFWRNIAQAFPDYDLSEKTALVLGAGGAARAIVWALINAGAGSVMICNRTASKAQALAEEFGDLVTMTEWSNWSDTLENVDFLVNTTALGMIGQPSLEFDLTNLSDDAVVTDIVYAPLETELLKSASAKGCKTVDGLGMLLHQAAPGFEAWFNVKPEVTVGLREAVLK